nr:dentin sialophosphoprotein-like [Ipomoea batatas]
MALMTLRKIVLAERKQKVKNGASLGETGMKPSLEDSSNPTEGTIEAKEQQSKWRITPMPWQGIMEAKEQQQRNDLPVQGMNPNAVGGETSLEDNSNPILEMAKKNTVPREQTDSSDANSISSSTNGESSSNSTSGEQSSVSAAQTEMTKGLTKQMSGADSGSGVKKLTPQIDNKRDYQSK